MTEVEITHPRGSISKTAAMVAIGAIAAYQGLLIVLIFLRPDLDPSWHTVSEWAWGQYGWMMSGAFFLSSISYGALFFMLGNQVRGIIGRIGLALLAVCCIGALGVGLCRTDPMPLHYPLSARGTVHVIAGGSQLMLLPFAALSLNLDLALRNADWARAKSLLLWTAYLPLFGWACFVGYTIAIVTPMGKDAYGPGVNIGWPPRFAFLTYALWLIVISWQGHKLERMAQS